MKEEGNLNEWFDFARRVGQKIDLDVAEANGFPARACSVCGVVMLTQPSAMSLSESGPLYYCESHIPK